MAERDTRCGGPSGHCANLLAGLSLNSLFRSRKTNQVHRKKSIQELLTFSTIKIFAHSLLQNHTISPDRSISPGRVVEPQDNRFILNSACPHFHRGGLLRRRRGTQHVAGPGPGDGETMASDENGARDGQGSGESSSPAAHTAVCGVAGDNQLTAA